MNYKKILGYTAFYCPLRNRVEQLLKTPRPSLRMKQLNNGYSGCD
jgi:hypothetical protein